MSQQQTVNVLLVIQALMGVLVAMRALYLNGKSRSNELVILGMAMITIAVASVSGLVADNLFPRSNGLFGGTLNVLWFEYGGQTISYFFIFLSTLQDSERDVRNLKHWHFVVTALLIVLLACSPLFPPLSPNAQAVLSNTRTASCAVLFVRYTYFFFVKETRFSFLMALAFFLLTFGIFIITVQFYPQKPLIDIYVGYAMRISGLISLFLAFWVG